MKNIELPRKVLVGEDAVYEVDEVVAELDLQGKPLILCDEKTGEIAGETVAVEVNGEVTIAEDVTDKTLDELKEKVKRDNAQYVVGVGGGKILDASKIISFESKLPLISVPTSASHDGIASPQASLKRDRPLSVGVHCPLGVICDTKIIAKAPRRLLASGCADAISNYTAVLDWKLAHDEKGEYYGDYAAALSSMSAEIVMNKAQDIYDDISVLVEALISSGVAIGIAGSSRPCSGSEHMFSHTLDIICEEPALHGEQCGVGAIVMAYLHDAEWRRIRNALKKCKAPTNAKDLRIGEDLIVEALVKAHEVRERHTILRAGITEGKARQAAEESGVI
ncbi:MAG: NAD(P)-dependent glycerol-1-phosphate dehydrogenase [Candidatus Altiarchaeales archaeon]|nr:NAD(P)-dependent glycerol-1-phosphate dehydrogenase [Candidatus Altiarchaeales archaeon]MBD3415983.1 NAD(P)-dependent glycerol-1-phosphate dehydrogenase [Candidatus Altiarchaeales archaeon]